MIKSDEYYTYPQETWNRATCAKKANHTATDAVGTKYPFKGYIGPSLATCPYDGYGKLQYNGGTVIEGDWYEGIIRPLPEIHSDFEIVYD